MTTLTLYDNPLSGHAHRPRCLLALLDVEYERVIVDLAAGEHKSPGFLAINPLGQVPALVHGELKLRDSTAILVYLAKAFDPDRRWLPSDPGAAAMVQSWLAVSTKEVYEGPCAARLNKLFAAPFDHPTAVSKTETLLGGLFEPHLEDRDWLVGDAPTIADVANYGYIAAAHEGGIDIGPWPAVTRWIQRLESIERFEPMPAAADILGSR